MNRTVIILSALFLVACLDPEYIPTGTPPQTAPNTIATAAKKDAGIENSSATVTTNVPTIAVTRHLPGTAITTATGKYTYLVQSDGTISPFASAALVTASGYAAATVITVTETELYCYGRGDQITSALPAPASGKLRDGALVKEKGKTDTYAISDGVAWPIVNGTVFAQAGYDFANVVELAAGSLAGKVEAVGNCVAGIACLDEAYLLTCADEVIGDLEPTTIDTSTATQVATSTPTATQTSVATSAPTNTATSVATVTPTATATTVATAPNTSSATQTATSTPTATQTAVATSTPTNTATASATTTPTATATTTTVVPTATQTATATVSSTATCAPTSTVTTTSTSSVTSNQQPTTVDLSWAWDDVGTKLCLNAAYFVGAGKAVLLVWEGPAADASNGPVAEKDNSRYCWDFAGKAPGAYRFWADAPISSCGGGICPRDHDDSTGALYYRGTLLTPAAHAWFYCPTADSGCDGIAYWDGASFTPMGK